ncbi:hypothetical protein HUU42_07620, partial [bacterium]|nr:hypothetical protein [bacterium]
MKKAILLILSAMAISYGLIQTAESKEDNPSRLKAKLRKPDVIDQKFIATNNWQYAMRSNGSFMYDPNDIDHDGNNAGGIFPRTENKTLIWAGGMYIATLKQGIPVCSEIEFMSEFQPGRITNSRTSWDSLLYEDPNGANQKVYYLDRDHIDNEWPDDAPRDIFGKPALIADAQTWMVFNDLDTSLSQKWPNGTPDDYPGLGLEVTLLSFIFSTPGFDNAVIYQVTIRNKTRVNYNDSYFGLWADPDIDSGTNDIVGTDTTRGLGFAYNVNNSDYPAAVGFDFLQGPVAHVNDISQKDVEKFKNQIFRLSYDPQYNIYRPKPLESGQITLSATMHASFISSSDPFANEHRYNLLKGLFAGGMPKSGTGDCDYYVYRGDPLALEASTDPNVEPYGGDHRTLLGTGPFTLPADSSQEVWFAVIGAKGQDRLDAVRQLFKTDDIVQSVFNQGLVTPQPPEMPQLSVSALDNRVVLTWQNNSEYSED